MVFLSLNSNPATGPWPRWQLSLLILVILTACGPNPDRIANRQLQERLTAKEKELEQERYQNRLLLCLIGFASGTGFLYWLQSKRIPTPPSRGTDIGPEAESAVKKNKSHLNAKGECAKPNSAADCHVKNARTWLIDGTSICFGPSGEKFDLRNALSLIHELNLQGHTFKVIFDSEVRNRVSHTREIERRCYEQLIRGLPRFFEEVLDRHSCMLSSAQRFGSTVLSTDLIGKDVVRVKVMAGFVQIEQLRLSLPIAKDLERLTNDLVQTLGKDASSIYRHAPQKKSYRSVKPVFTRNAQYREVVR